MSHSWVRDLGQEVPTGDLEADICIVGAGPVGLVAARAFAAHGRRVIVLEQGALAAKDQTESKEVQYDRRPYRGATAGRAFGVGGTSALWGGQLLPVRPSDVAARPQNHAPAWPVSYAELAPYFAELEQWLKVIPGVFGLEYAVGQAHRLATMQWQDWVPRFSKWIPFGRRNVFEAFAPSLAASQAVTLYSDARVEEWHLEGLDGTRQVNSVTARSTSGNEIQVRARCFVICAGALESVRCVLEMNDAAGGLGNMVGNLAGKFLHDHLSLRLARIEILDRAAFQELFAPHFSEDTLRSLRMELSNEFLTKAGLPALYAHFVIEADANSGFALLRDVFRSLQKSRFQEAVGRAARLPFALPGVIEILYERFVRRRLPYPRGAQVFLHCDVEQPPLAENRVYLGQRDSAGRRVLHVDWDIGIDIKRVATDVQGAFARFWTANGLERIATVKMLDYGSEAPLDPTNLYDIYHPAGTLRMSADPAAGVVDQNLLIRGTSNAYVAGSAVFPSMGAANPTFTAMALGLRLVDEVDRKLNRNTGLS